MAGWEWGRSGGERLKEALGKDDGKKDDVRDKWIERS